MVNSIRTDPDPASLIDGAPRYRSGAAARLAGLPVATLRTWEQRFQVVAPALSSGGHRLYSAADVQRLALLKQLTAGGHAISLIAHLDIDQLRGMARTQAAGQARAESVADDPADEPRRRLMVVGAMLAARLQGAAMRRRLASKVQVIASFADLADCQQAATGGDDALMDRVPSGPLESPPTAPDLLLVEVPALQAEQVSVLGRLAQDWGASRLAVMHSYVVPGGLDAARAAGISVQRSRVDDEALCQWLLALVQAPEPLPSRQVQTGWPIPAVVSARRFDDKTLADLAMRSSSVACECPRHVSELLIMLSAFETYSAQCAAQSADDAALHRDLQRAAGAARAILETAIERIALHEGLDLGEGLSRA
jgi:DNA-binding transcriptional MerR regulator